MSNSTKIFIKLALLMLLINPLKSEFYWIDTGLKETSFITSIAVDKDDIIYCSTWNGHIRKFEWGNDKWELLNDTTLKNYGHKVAVDNKGNLWTDIFENSPQVSSDGGTSWSYIDNGLPEGTYRFILGASNIVGELYIINYDFPYYILRLNQDYELIWEFLDKDNEYINEIYDYDFDYKGNLYFAENYYWKPYHSLIWEYDNMEKQLVQIKDTLFDKYIINVAIDKRDNIYIVTYIVENYEYKLYLEWWNNIIKKWEILTELVPACRIDILPTVVKVIFINEFEYLIGIPGGIGKGNTKDFKIENINNGLVLPDKQNLTCIYVGANGHVYLGTSTGKVYVSSEKLVGVKENYSFTGVGLSPNPVSDIVSVNISSEIFTNANIEIYNLLGIKQTEFDFDLNVGENTIPIDVSILASGVYFIVFNNGNETKKTMFIKE